MYCGHSTFMNSHSSHAPTPLALQPPSPDARTGTRPFHAPLSSSAGRSLHTACAATNATRPAAHAGSSDTAAIHRPTILTKRERACIHYGFNFRGLFVGSLVFLHVVSVVRGRSSRVEGGMRGWSSPGRLGSGGRGWRGSRSSTGTAAFIKAGFVPDDEAPALMISLELALAAQAPVHDKAQAPSSAPPQPGPPDSPTRVPARRSERAKCPKRRRSARAPCSTTPKAHRKHTGNTPKSPGHRLVSWRHPRHRGFNPLRFGHTQPNNPRQPTPPPRRPTKNNRPLENDA